MSYQVLARKWRPRTFSEMAGQEHVLRALINALDNGRLHHAFLFTGTRGVGKTTIARILAKSLNCEQGVGSSPCGQCSACKEIDEGRFVDLLEVDAASRTKVEDTRELLDNVQYAPTRGRYKVYLIDEVHMLSKHSFNALLKTLEEPPPHVKFLLATTDPQKLPVTILSRCLQFNLKRLPRELIAEHMAHILTAEQIEFDAAALQQLARAADGSMRDALSLLDQAIAFAGGRLAVAEVCAMLGTLDSGHVFDLLAALADSDGSALLGRVAQLAERTPDFSQVLEEMLSVLHRVALAQLVPDAVDDGDGERERILALAARVAAEDTQLWYQIALQGRRDLALATDARAAFEMTLIRMLAFRLEGAAGGAAPRPGGAQAATAPAAAQGASAAGAGPTAAARGDWQQIVAALQLGQMARQLAENCVLARHDDNGISLLLDRGHAHLRSPGTEKKLEAALQQYFSTPLKVEISIGAPDDETPAARSRRQRADRQQAAKQAIENDSTVQVLQERFNARVVPDSVQPLD